MPVSESFLASVRYHFSPLLDQLGYYLESKLQIGDAWRDGLVYLTSPATRIRIAKDRETIDVSFGPQQEPEKDGMNLLLILESLSVLKAESFSAYAMNEEYNGIITKYADLMMQHCLPEIRGDFSRWRTFKEYELHWFRDIQKIHPSGYAHLEEYVRRLGENEK